LGLEGTSVGHLVQTPAEAGSEQAAQDLVQLSHVPWGCYPPPVSQNKSSELLREGL